MLAGGGDTLNCTSFVLSLQGVTLEASPAELSYSAEHFIISRQGTKSNTQRDMRSETMTR